ncbi:hypothetical protein [Streptomyces noursei]|uniref:hypothetical protein n=1 Tax=Streptomyces noursei TaxID=1971 RepID=UPI0021553DDF|nr:hypothetical protein [Streptomyces noursei]
MRSGEIAGPAERDQEGDVGGAGGGQRRHPAALAESPEPDQVRIDVLARAQQAYPGQCVVRQQVVVTVGGGVSDRPLVEDERGDAGAGEGLGLLPVLVPGAWPRAADEHDARAGGRAGAWMGAWRVRAGEYGAVEDEAATTPEGDVLADRVAVLRVRVGPRRGEQHGERDPGQGQAGAYERLDGELHDGAAPSLKTRCEVVS